MEPLDEYATTTVRMFPDYADTVLWFPEPVPYDVAKLSQGLEQDLQEWERSFYDALTHRVRWRAKAAARRLDKRGHKLAERVASELGDEFSVEYRSLVDSEDVRNFGVSNGPENPDAAAAFAALAVASREEHERIEKLMAEDGENFGWFAYAPHSQTVFRSSEHPHGTPPTQVLFLGGRSGVGKSTVALALHDLLRERDIHHALIDGDNLDLAHPAPWVEHPDARLAENNLAAMWGNYRALGYSRLIYTNTVSVLQMSRLSMALGGEVDAVGILLEASDRQVRRRLGRRERGRSLRDHVQQSRAAAKRLAYEAPTEVNRVNTNGRTPEDVAAGLLEFIDWE